MHKITKSQTISHSWDQVTSLNYKILHTNPKQSVVYAKLDGDHGWVHTEGVERIYYILTGSGEFETKTEKIEVNQGDVITLPPHTEYDYHPTKGSMEILLFMELWDN